MKKDYGLLTNEQADYLLKLPKKILSGKEVVNEYRFDQPFPFQRRIELISPVDDEFTFLWDIKQSAKNMIRINLHVQDDDSNIGLLRVDFNSGHRNPEAISDLLPERFHPYAGKEFSNNEHHVHYHVEGYKSLAWAIPLFDDEFEIKNLSEGANFNTTFIETIVSFAKTINLETKIIINPLLL